MYYPQGSWTVFQDHLALLSTLVHNVSDPLKLFLDAEGGGGSPKVGGPEQSSLLMITYKHGHLPVGLLEYKAVGAVRQIIKRVIRYVSLKSNSTTPAHWLNSSHALQKADSSSDAGSFLRKVWAEIADSRSQYRMEPNASILLIAAVGEILHILWSRESLPKSMNVTPADVQRQRHDFMCSTLARLPAALDSNDGRNFLDNLKEPSRRVRLCVIIDSLSMVVDLLRVNPRLMTPGGCKNASPHIGFTLTRY